MSHRLRTLWQPQQIGIEGIGSIEVSPYDMILYDAILNSDDELMLMMLNKGALPDNLVPMVVDRGTPSVIEIIIELGANVDKLTAYLTSKQKLELLPNDPSTLLGIGLRKAISNRNIATIHLILIQLTKDEDLPVKDLALGMAVRLKDPKIVIEILKTGQLNPNQGLHYAAQFNDVEIARLMIAHGADIDSVLALEESRGLVNMSIFLKSLK